MVLRGGPSHEDAMKYELLKSPPSPAEPFNHTIPVSFALTNVLAFELIHQKKSLFWGKLLILYLSDFSLPADVRDYLCLC